MVPDIRRLPLPVKPADPVLLPASCSWVHLPDAGLLLLVTGLLLPLSRDWPALPADARAADAKELLLLLLSLAVQAWGRGQAMVAVDCRHCQQMLPVQQQVVVIV